MYPDFFRIMFNVESVITQLKRELGSAKRLDSSKTASHALATSVGYAGQFVNIYMSFVDSMKAGPPGRR